MNKSKNRHYYRITLEDAFTTIAMPKARSEAHSATTNLFATAGGER